MAAPLSSLSATAAAHVVSLIGCTTEEAAERLGPWVNDDAVLELAVRLAVAPAIAAATLRARIPMRAEWTELAAERAALNHLMLLDAAAIHQHLEDAGIPCIFIKGLALIADVFDDAACRHLDDLDVVVPPHLASRARQILVDRGFTNEARFDQVAFDGRDLLEHDTDNEELHALPGLVSPLGTAVDLHRHVAEAPDWTYDVLARDSRMVQVPGGGSVRIPSPQQQVRILCEHVLVHHDGVLRFWPRHLFDLGALQRRYGAAIDLPDPSVRACLLVLRQLRGRPGLLAAFIAPDPRVDRASELLAYSSRVLHRNVELLVSDPSRVLRKTFPSRAFIARHYNTTEDDPKLPLYYAHRLVTLRFLRVMEAR